MINKDIRPFICIYPTHYLPLSNTFVYRQLIGVADEFNPIVLASQVYNRNVFPHDFVFVKKKSFFERVYIKLCKIFTGRYAMLSPLQIKYWQQILRAYDVCLIHAHFGPAGLEILPLAKQLKIQLITTFRGFDASSLLKNKQYTSDLLDLFEYSHIITVSKSLANKLIAVGANPSQTEVHYNGIPVEDFKYIERIPVKNKTKNGHKIELLQISRFVEKKGHKFTLTAFKEFLSICPNSELTLAGDGPLKSSMMALTRDLGLQDKVRFIGEITQEEVISLMEKSDIFLQHSVTASNGDEEGLPTVLCEAMSSGMIVISTFHSGIPELIDNGVDGFLVYERDIKNYVNTLRAALNCDDGMGKRASRKISDNFNLALQNLKLKDKYRKVITNGIK